MADIFDTADRFRREMLRRERAAASEIVRRYGELWQRIRVRIDGLTKKYYAAAAEGKEVSVAWLYQLERLQSLQRQVEAEMREFAAFADTRIQAQQQEAVTAAQLHAEALMQASMGQEAAMATAFNRLPREAVASLIGFTQDGSPLADLLAKLGPEASEAIKQELISGLGLGLSPREVARKCRAALGGNLTRALTISRTETLRAYREATHQAFEANSSVVEGWIWYCGQDERTCAACWAMHGTEHGIEERLDDHPNGRCVALPKTRTWAELGLEGVPESGVRSVAKGSELFAKLPAEQQLAILGPAKCAAYQAGRFEFGDLVGQAQDKMWGSWRYERSLADIIGRSEARKWAKLAKQAGRQQPVWQTISETDLETWGMEEAEKWLESLTAAERQAVVDYTGPDYHVINDLLRAREYTRGKLPEQIARLVQDIDGGLRKATLEGDLVVYRGFGSRPLEQLVQVGDVFYDAGFASTSLTKEVAEGFLGEEYPILAEVRVPKGTQVAYVERITQFQKQYELLLPRWTRFKVLSLSRVQVQGRPVLYLLIEVLPKE